MRLKNRKQFSRLETDLNSLLELLQKYPEEILNRAPKDNSWSALQVMHHLMLSEKYALQYVKKKMSFEDKFAEAGIMTSVRSFGLNAYLNSPFRRNAPEAVSGDNLPKESSFWETAKEWKKQRKELEAFLSNQPNDAWTKEIYKFPGIGRVTFSGMLSFFQSHFNRHRKQIKNALKEYKYVLNEAS